MEMNRILKIVNLITENVNQIYNVLFCNVSRRKKVQFLEIILISVYRFTITLNLEVYVV